MRELCKPATDQLTLLLLCSALFGCGGNDNERETWVTAKVNTFGGTPWFYESEIIPDLTARGVTPKETIYGAVAANFDQDAVTVNLPPDRVYHFRVSEPEAVHLIATNKYIYRDSYNSALPFTAIRCSLFGLVPRT